MSIVMKKMLGIGSMALAGALSVSAADVSVGIDFASAYIFRGVTLNDGWVAQPGLEVSGLHGFTVGTWANFDLEDNTGGAPSGGDFSEVDLYVSYAIPVEGFGLSIGLTEYTYPRGVLETEQLDGTVTTEPLDADRELNLILSLDDVPLAPSLGVYYGLDGLIDKALYLELGLSHEEALTEDVTASVGLAVGYVEPDAGDSGFNHATISAGLGYKFASLGVIYVVETDDKVQEIDEDIAVTIGFSGSF
jgi:uncharacterized protein (TIGR02001 family)